MGIELNLQKSAQNLQFSLQKRGLHTPPKVELAFDLDVSGSYKREHNAGHTNLLIARMTPWGTLFDPDQQLDIFTFSDGQRSAYNVGQVNINNYHDFVQKNILGPENLGIVPGYGGCTDYHYVLRENLKNFGWLPEDGPSSTQKKGLFGGIFGKHQSTVAQPQSASIQRQSLVIFNTDGANDDEDETDALFQQMQDNKWGMYVMFLAVNRNPREFEFIEKMAAKYDNVGLCIIENVEEWVNQTDEEINEELITDELVRWLKAA